MAGYSRRPRSVRILAPASSPIVKIKTGGGGGGKGGGRTQPPPEPEPPPPSGIEPDEVTTATLYAWHEADLITPQADDTRIAPWADAGAGGRTLTQTTEATKPFYRTTGPNGQPFVEFKGAEVLTGSTNLGTRTQPQTIFAVARWDTATASILHGGASSDHLAILWGASGLQMYSISAGPAWAGGSLETWMLLTCYFNGTSSYMRVNGVQVATGNTGAAVGQRIDMGALNRFGAAGFDGGVAARIMYEGTLSDTERDDLETRCMTKYDL